ncbi:ABC transporter ATP-binding protein [Hoeflea prorocentri]|uniref:ABC transporter ATP-binding protein n=1 Tax=Hoeflea prorocentri TaxID=1922333 RepID=A0A9X3UJQ2_9HYPH|nr:ABC transporter ATP-binding protein [Hoeflea prorocentri]MCY6381836.1 ABC transporter ATP-binding protein [Hoeflea prorocentri]MDA5399636.1 ABC transporter ATP-binding protein [Hoeflea prorocentri]
MSTPRLSVENLTISLNPDDQEIPLVEDLSFDIAAGETLCLVGESGCGKSISSLAIMGLLNPAMKVTKGRILFEGTDLVRAGPRELRMLRGDRIAMIFQEPMTSLNPVMKIGDQIAEVFIEHRGGSRRDALKEAERMLDMVQIPDAKRRVHAYPHELSGGMRQRAMIAMALGLDPAVLIADEPTTALDVTIQAQVLRLMSDLCGERGTGLLLITHDLGVVAEMADKVLVLYAGQQVEEAPVLEIFDNARHPYTQGLLNSVQQLQTEDRMPRLMEIPGTVPLPSASRHGCQFRGRCALASERCSNAQTSIHISPDHSAACWRVQEPREAT